MSNKKIDLIKKRERLKRQGFDSVCIRSKIWNLLVLYLKILKDEDLFDEYIMRSQESKIDIIDIKRIEYMVINYLEKFFNINKDFSFYSYPTKLPTCVHVDLLLKQVLINHVKKRIYFYNDVLKNKEHLELINTLKANLLKIKIKYKKSNNIFSYKTFN